jgi:hypothetical protein
LISAHTRTSEERDVSHSVKTRRGWLLSPTNLPSRLMMMHAVCEFEAASKFVSTSSRSFLLYIWHLEIVPICLPWWFLHERNWILLLSIVLPTEFGICVGHSLNQTRCGWLVFSNELAN